MKIIHPKALKKVRANTKINDGYILKSFFELYPLIKINIEVVRTTIKEINPETISNDKLIERI